MYDISSKKKLIDLLINKVNCIKTNAETADAFDDWMFDIEDPQVVSFSSKDKVFYKVSYGIVSTVCFDNEGHLKLDAGKLSLQLAKNIYAEFHYILITAYSIGKYKVFYRLIHDKLNKNIEIDRHSFDIADNKLEIE